MTPATYDFTVYQGTDQIPARPAVPDSEDAQ